MIVTIILMKNHFLKLKNEGQSISLDNPTVLQSLNTIKVEDARKTILEKYQLD